MTFHQVIRDFNRVLTTCLAILIGNLVLAQNNKWVPAIGLNLSSLAKVAVYPKSFGSETTFEYLNNKKHGPVLNLLYSRDKALSDTPSEIQDWVANTWMFCGGYTFSNLNASNYKSFTKFTLLVGYYHTKVNGIFAIYNPFFPSNFYRVPFEQARDSYIVEGKLSNYLRLTNKLGLDFGVIVGWANNVTNRSGWNLETAPIVSHHFGPIHFRLQGAVWLLPTEN